MGFLKKIKGEEEDAKYLIKKIIKAKISLEELNYFLEQLNKHK